MIFLRSQQMEGNVGRKTKKPPSKAVFSKVLRAATLWTAVTGY